MKLMLDQVLKLVRTAVCDLLLGEDKGADLVQYGRGWTCMLLVNVYWEKYKLDLLTYKILE